MWTKPTEYAIRALVYVAIQNRKGHRPGYREIAAAVDSPEQFTAKILQRLTKASLISSVRGRGGGFFFRDPDQKLLLFDIIRVLEGDLIFDRCGFGFSACDSHHPCPMHDHFFKIRTAFVKMTKSESVQSLVKKIDEKKAVLSRINFN